MYSQLFLISLNEKGSFFKPVMFEFPEDKNSYEDIENKIMFGEAFLICAFNEVNEKDKEFTLPKEGFNRYPTGKLILDKNDANNKITLSGKLDEVHIFLREGFIIPKQNTFEKYILNTMKLREEKIDLIINVNSLKQSHGVIFFDNDDANTISEKKYYKVELNFTDNVLNICTEKNNLSKYNYNDHILGTIELWNANNVFVDANKEENKDKKYSLEIQLTKEKKEIDGSFDSENNKIVFDVNGKEKGISLFDINKILFNFK
jgi:alpha-glucosidase (family GH31 glycosyl hydrolase)